jgi:hypothetical protein
MKEYAVVTARTYNRNEIIDSYKYEKPLNKDSKECLNLWMNFMEYMFPKCTFEVINYRSRKKLVLEKVVNDDLF